MAIYRGKHITIGLGTSDMSNGYDAAKYAAEKSIFLFEKPRTFSIVYASSNLDPKEVLRGINEVLGENDWVGASADRQFSTIAPYSDKTSVTVLSIQSDYMHFGIGVANNYRRNAQKGGLEATKQALKNIRSDKYIDAYVQFNRHKHQDYSRIVRHPPYFILTYASGAEYKKGKPVSGEEIDFLKGIQEHLGPNIPIFGGGASSDFQEYLELSKGSNYLFANGKLYDDAGIVVFAISNLYFSSDVLHSYIPTEKSVSVTKIDRTGHEILELNGKEPVEEYCSLIGVKKEDYLKEPFMYSLKNPLGMITPEGSFVKEALPNKDGKTLHSTYKLMQNYVLSIMKYDDKSHYNTMQQSLKKALKYDKTLCLGLYCTCSTRRLLEGDDTGKIINSLTKSTKVPIMGFYAFSEIGNTKTGSAQVHGESVTAMFIYDKLLVD
ncbi:MAG: FIST signal transduction protein [Candidatus Woesearchaeota archaeon]